MKPALIAAISAVALLVGAAPAQADQSVMTYKFHGKNVTATFATYGPSAATVAPVGM